MNKISNLAKIATSVIAFLALQTPSTAVASDVPAYVMPPNNKTVNFSAMIPIPNGKETLNGMVAEVEYTSGTVPSYSWFDIKKDGQSLRSDGAAEGIPSNTYTASRFYNVNPYPSQEPEVAEYSTEQEVTLSVHNGDFTAYPGQEFTVYVRGAHGDPKERVLTPDMGCTEGPCHNPTTLSDRREVVKFKVVDWVQWNYLCRDAPTWPEMCGPKN